MMGCNFIEVGVPDWHGYLDRLFIPILNVMKKSSVVVVWILKFWMALSLLLAVVFSSILAAPFMLVGYIMDLYTGQNKFVPGKMHRVNSPSNLGFSNL